MAKKTSPVKTAAKKQNKTPRLSAGLKRQIKIQRALYEIADAASAVTDMQSFYKRLQEIVGTLMYAENFVIMLFDATTNTRSYPYYSDSADDVAPPSSPIPEQSLLAELIRNPRTLHYNRQQNEEAIRRGEMFGTPAESFVGVPFKMGDQVIGGIIVQSYIKKVAYSEEDVSVLEFVAQHIAVALTRARAIEETRQRNSELAIINSVQAALAAQLDIHGIYEAVGEKLREVFNYQDVTIYTGDLRSHIMTIEYSYVRGEKGERQSVPMNSLYEYFVTSNRTFVFNGDIPSFVAKFSDYQNPEPPKSLLAVPVRRNQDTEPVVYLTIQDWDGKTFFSDSDVRLMETLANSMSVALENARLFDETQQRNAELAIINSVQAALAAQLDIHGIYDALGEKLREIFSYQDVTIYSADLKTQTMTIEYGFEKGRKFERISVPMNSMYEYLVAANKTFVFNGNVAEFAAQFKDYKVPAGELSRSVLIVPVLRKKDSDLAIYLTLQDVEGRRFFSDSDVRLLETLANSMSVALENARLFDETQRLFRAEQERTVELQVINSIQQGLASKLDMQGIYDLVGDAIGGIFPDAEAVLIYSIDLQSKHLDFNYALEKGQRFQLNPDFYENQPCESFYNKLACSTEPLVINSNCHAFMIENGLYVVEGTEEPKSAVFIPLIAGDRVLSQISLQNIEREYAFKDSDIRLLSTLANAMSVALENARLWEQEKLYRKALEREFEIGREIQTGFLPETLPQPKGWEIAASLKSAREVAGDFYDVFELPEDKIGLVIGDVCDKGLGAALFMTLFRSLLRAVSNIDFYARVESADGTSPAARLKHAISLTNNYISETHGDTGMFATIFFGILDSRTGALTYINGGHLPPMLVNAQGLKEILKISGPAIGAMADADYVIREVMIEHGESFFAYTDGLTDTVNPAGEFFSEKDLIPFLIEDKPLSPLLTEFQKRVADHAAGVKQFDDITLLAARRI